MRVIYIHRSQKVFLSKGSKSATSYFRRIYLSIRLHLEHTNALPYLYELGKIITANSLSLLSDFYHSRGYYSHNGPQLAAENRLIYFSFITSAIGANLSPCLSICLYECICVLTEPVWGLLYYLEVSFFIESTSSSHPTLSSVQNFYLL